MTISKIIASVSLAFALSGGALVLTATEAGAAGKKSTFISYDALKKNRVPCSKKGSSSSNCKVGPPANQYNRGCSEITRCKRG